MAANYVRPKFVMLGKSYVGKSSLVMRLLTDSFREYLQPTQADFYTCKRTIGDRVIHFDLWDTAGQERFKSLLPMYTRDAMVGIVVFDVNDPLSLESAVDHLKSNQHLRILALVANKIDMIQSVDHDPIIEEAKKHSVSYNANFYAVSAKTGAGVAKLFDSLALAAMQANAKPGDPDYIPSKDASPAPTRNVDVYDRVNLSDGAAMAQQPSSRSCWLGGFFSWWTHSPSSSPAPQSETSAPKQ